MWLMMMESSGARSLERLGLWVGGPSVWSLSPDASPLCEGLLQKGLCQEEEEEEEERSQGGVSEEGSERSRKCPGREGERTSTGQQEEGDSVADT